jgi:hypothetical protein
LIFWLHDSLRSLQKVLSKRTQLLWSHKTCTKFPLVHSWGCGIPGRRHSTHRTHAEFTCQQILGHH